MRIMIVSSFDDQVTQAAHIAVQRGAQVTHVQSIGQALETLRKGHGADVLFVDLYNDIKYLMEALETERFNIPVIACGINADPRKAAEAIKAGAKEYIPFPPEAEVISAILQGISHQDKKMIFRDPEMLRVISMADRVAPSEANILITGESGTGKEVLARYLHQHSRRKEKPFVSINCAAIPENLLESELFGHEKGAFTGAVARRLGKFEEAHGGTLLLDEISEMHIRLQAKLLRAIQERTIDRVGGDKPVKVDIRIIATSNRNLKESCANGEFREDLFYRLSVMNLHLPPLRQRPKDVEALANYFVEKYTALNHLPAKHFSSSALNALKTHPWPGNVRQLENTIHRGVLLAQDSCIEPHDLFDAETLESKALPITSTLDRQLFIGRSIAAVEKEHILTTLDHCQGNRTHAANMLGISIRTLRNKIKEYELSEIGAFSTL